MSKQLELENYQTDLQQLPLAVVEKQAFEEQQHLVAVAWALTEE